MLHKTSQRSVALQNTLDPHKAKDTSLDHSQTPNVEFSIDTACWTLRSTGPARTGAATCRRRPTNQTTPRTRRTRACSLDERQSISTFVFLKKKTRIQKASFPSSFSDFGNTRWTSVLASR